MGFFFATNFMNFRELFFPENAFKHFELVKIHEIRGKKTFKTISI
jgi:hypothetical protein